MSMKYLLVVILAVGLLAACSSSKRKYEVPRGNLESINSDSNDVSPFQLVDPSLKSGCSSEFAEDKKIGAVASSNNLMLELIKNQDKIKTESISPLDDYSGILAVAHPPDSISQLVMNLELGGIVGGTDLFEYEIVNGNKYFALLPEPINSITWDSHPYIVNIDNDTQLMLWASDRENNLGGHSLPFFQVPYVNFIGDTVRGNSDIYYAFKVSDVWTQVKNLELRAKGINTGFDEISPSLFCLCYKTKLLFSSNRNNADENDFDIYTADIIIDRDKQEILLDGLIDILPKGEDAINTQAKEFFPLVKKPYSGTDSAMIYFASNRNAEPKYIGGKTVQSLGKMDLYQMETQLDCRPAKIKYEVVLLDGEDTSRQIPLPYIKIFNEDGTKPLAQFDTNHVSYEFQFGRKYLISGGSYFNKIECKGGDSVIQYYINNYIEDRKLSEYAKLSRHTQFRAIPESFPRNDTIIRDTIIIYPKYYHFPPCKWEFTENLEKYRRNVPYFQTGYWEVNTRRNLSQHIRKFNRKKYAEASFIELHPKNQYFGHKRGNLSEDQQKSRERKRYARQIEYDNYSKLVDQNIADMAHEIGETILTAFDELRANVPQSDSRLVIQVHAFSDVRPIQKGEFLGDSTVQYVSCYYDGETNNTLTSQVKIAPRASLVGQSNETLSELRAYYGYKELLKKLMEYPKFAEYYERGEVLLPDECSSEQEYKNQIAEKKIVIMIQGMSVDEDGTYEIAGYKRKTGDFYDLDVVRRINVIIDRMEISGKKLTTSECCSEGK
jgi:hypothetical protein